MNVSALLGLFLLGLSSCSTGMSQPSGKQEIYSGDALDFWGINFKPGQPLEEQSLQQSLATERDQQALRNDLMTLKAMPSDIRLRVLGFTDTAECSGHSCEILSRRRAKKLNEWFLKQGISPNRLEKPIGFGSERPIDSNETEEGRARNRRAYVSYETQ